MALTIFLAFLSISSSAAIVTTRSYDTFADAGIFPLPLAKGSGDWAEAYTKAGKLVSHMTLEEMNNVTHGYSSVTNGCSGNSGSAPRLGYPGMCLHDAENGVRYTDGITSFPSALHVGASWNSQLANDRGRLLGAEFKAKGVNVALGPAIQPLGSVALGGRNFEGFGADPYLNGILGAQIVRSMQENVIASVKHFVAYEQATFDGPNLQNNIPGISFNVDDKTMHELYLWPFHDLIYAGAACVMCSYNRINETYACENSKVMNDLLKRELNFQGFVVSDWSAQHSGLKSANAGLDMAMPTSAYWDNNQLASAAQNGSFSQARLKDMATRIIASWYQLQQDDEATPASHHPGFGMPENLSQPHKLVNARDPAANLEGHVLVKNDGSLPLKKPAVLSLFGYDELILSGSNLGFANPPNRTTYGTLFCGGGSGSNSPPYIDSPYNALSRRVHQPVVIGSSEACLVFINQFSSEVFDRGALSDAYSDELVLNVAAQCANTIVIIHNAGIRIVDAWIDHENITAVIYAHLPAKIPAVHFPSGRLPYTVAKKSEDYGSLLSPCSDQGDDPLCAYTEGVNIDYRHFLAHNIQPRFEFGFGLTYTNFEYSDLRIDIKPGFPSYSSPRPIGTSNERGLFENVAVITATVTNTGNTAAAEVAQLYLQLPGETRTLRGFDKVMIEPKRSKR
ncbi:putative beta-glucosidase [Xylogone sp. PMI_703]|nr:putative beta-glucosidase [Xylogone sp. PMI_703]